MCVWKVIILLLSIHLIEAKDDENLIISECQRVIDLKTQLIKIKYELTFENTGTNIIESFKWSANENGKLTQLEAIDSTGIMLNISKDERYHVMQLSRFIGINSSEEIIINEVYARGIQPLPKEIKQNEQQFVIYVSNIYLETSYFVTSQTTVVILPNNHIDSFTIIDPMVFKDNQIIYGPYENIPPLTYNILKVYFINNGPFLTVPELKRKITLSHWGYITIEENIKLIHTGAKLKGPFSRFYFDFIKDGSLNHIENIKTFLPSSAHDIYYRDDIGNITSSTVKHKDGYIQINLEPRFVFMGGWKTEYILGYKVPIYEYLFYDKNTHSFSFNMRFIDHIFNDMYVEKVETSVVLPVFANVITVNLPFEVKKLVKSVAYNYLDFKPREVLTYVKNDLTENHIKEFQIIYEYPELALVYQPILIVLFMYFLFLCVIVYLRIDFSLVNKEKKKC